MKNKFYDKIKWLENIGKKEGINTTISNKQILNIKDVEKHIKTELWSNILLEAQNELSIYLVDNDCDDLKWNIYVRKSKEIYSEQIEQLIVKKLKINFMIKLNG
jgi:phosphoribosylformylglycinamidine (FGAM) synthase-like enzyme